jgi:hypothetical protein
MWKIFKTKTFWVNTIGTGLIIVNELNGKVIPTEAAATILFVLNIANRFLTNKSVSAK